MSRSLCMVVCERGDSKWSDIHWERQKYLQSAVKVNRNLSYLEIGILQRNEEI